VSQKPVSPLHLEWTPDSVRAVNIQTGQKAEAANIAGLGSILSGQPQAIIGIGHSHIFLKSLRLPRATAADTRSILGVQIGQLFPLPADQLSFDFIPTEDQTVEGRLTVVAAMRASDLRHLRAELKQAGITAARILPVALAAASDMVGPRRQGLVLGLRFSRVAPNSSDPLAEARKTLAAARTESLPLITVGSVNLPDAITSLDTELSVLHEAPPFNFELSEDRVLEVRKQVAARTRLAVLMFLSALLLMVLVWANRSDAMAVVKHSQGVWARKLTTQESIQKAETAQTATVVAAQTTLERAYKPGQPLSDITSVVDDSLAPGSWLTGLTIERGKPLDIRGMTKSAGDVTKLVNTLSASPRFRDVRLVFANSAQIGKVPVVQFDVSAVCVGNLPMPTPVTTGRGRTAPRPAAPTGTGVS